MSGSRRWITLYGRRVFWARDARIAYGAAVLASVACFAGESVRDALTDARILGAIGGIGLAVVSVSLGSVALMAGLLDETFSFVISRAGTGSLDEGIEDALQPYQAMAVIGACTIGAAMLGLVATSAVENWIVDTVVATIAVLMGTWSVAGITLLVFLTALFARHKGSLLATRAEANVLRMKSAGQADPRERGTNAG